MSLLRISTAKMHRYLPTFFQSTGGLGLSFFPFWSGTLESKSFQPWPARFCHPVSSLEVELRFPAGQCSNCLLSDFLTGPSLQLSNAPVAYLSWQIVLASCRTVTGHQLWLLLEVPSTTKYRRLLLPQIWPWTFTSSRLQLIDNSRPRWGLFLVNFSVLPL